MRFSQSQHVRSGSKDPAPSKMPERLVAGRPITIHTSPAFLVRKLSDWVQHIPRLLWSTSMNFHEWVGLLPQAKAKEVAGKVEGEAKGVSEKVEGKAKGVSEKVEGKAKGVSEKVEGKAKGVSGKVEGKADEAAQEAQGAAKTADKKTPDSVDEAADEAAKKVRVLTPPPPPPEGAVRPAGMHLLNCFSCFHRPRLSQVSASDLPLLSRMVLKRAKLLLNRAGSK